MDPTIYDNLKVVLEGCAYDLDRDQRILIVDRRDVVDLAKMCRIFRIEYILADDEKQFLRCQVEMESRVQDFAAELQQIHLVDDKPGVRVSLRFSMVNWQGEESQWAVIHEQMKQWWEDTVIRHTLEKTWDPQKETRANRYICTLTFQGKIDEDNIDELPALLEHSVRTMKWLEGFLHT